MEWSLRRSAFGKVWETRRDFDPKPTGCFGNDQFGSRPEPGTSLIAFILLLPPGEVPEGRARGVQDTALQLESESEIRGPERETGVTLSSRSARQTDPIRDLPVSQVLAKRGRKRDWSVSLRANWEVHPC